MQQKEVHIVWLKRDLRIEDHAALYEAARRGPVLPIFTWDASVWSSPDYATQHVMFVRECLSELKTALQAIGLDLYQSSERILDVLNSLIKSHRISGLYSHEETGNQHTYALDLNVAAWCRQHEIPWHEYAQNGVVRRLKSRDHWNAIWKKRMSATLYPVSVASLAQLQGMQWVNTNIDAVPHLQKPQADKPYRQKGGRQQALKTLNSFLNGRASQYRGGISSPISSVEAGSRISPYLAWGVLSMKEVMHALALQRVRLKQNPDKYPKKLDSGLLGFESRLHWHCHFMQKLESEPEIEYQNLHHALNGIRDETYADAQATDMLQKWVQGRTGWPLVDACMAMLRETGWINFRMRAMLMSTASYLYWLHWREPGLHLAREFLDYEPGIHWSQVQMQSGTTGINTLRIYNPIKQAKDQDPQGHFVRRWIPALKNVPTTWIFEPWLMTPELQMQYQCMIGQDYPAPVISVESALKQARTKLTQAKYGASHIAETKRIVEKHASRKGRFAKTTSPAARMSKPGKASDQTSLSILGVQQTLF
jgi:deoxyribodipyrimidine photo-lyase